MHENGRAPPCSVSHSTVQRLCEGGISKSALNASKGWLTNSEARLIVDYCLEMANCGFPLSHEQIKMEVDTILRARLGDAFPEHGIGKQWTYCFVEKHRKEL
ncbi:hypothetical protein BT96DRAFT_824710, partial [Gymnopus androsaceus JB14]